MMKRKMSVAEEREIREVKYNDIIHSDEKVSEIFTRIPYSTVTPIRNAK